MGDNGRSSGGQGLGAGGSSDDRPAEGTMASSSASAVAGPSKAGQPVTTAHHRVAKACLPCSIKKRRCDGGKPECKVCMVLGTPCSYEIRGLKRGPPKGFRSGPKESARAKLLRTLETTIRDLSLHIGNADAAHEISRITGERGIELIAGAGLLSGAIKKESSAPPEMDRVARIKHEEGQQDDDDEEDEDVMGINEYGAMRHIGTSSGIQLLQHQQHHHAPSSSKSSPTDTSSRNHSVGTHHHQPPIVLPSITSTRMHGNSPSSHSGPSLPPSADAMTMEERRVSPAVNAKLFHHYWTGFHVFWPILYKPALDELSVDDLPYTLDTSLINAIYAMATCVAHPALDAELEAELGDGPPGEVFAQRAERHLFQARTTPTPSFASIQCCFLLACFYQGVGQLSKAFLFSSLANSMAIDLGLHRHLHHYEHDLIERESRNRLIHCVYILSTALASEMGRPPMLRSKDIDVPPLGETEKDEFERDAAGRPLHLLSLLNHSRRLFTIVETVLTQVHSFRRKAALRRLGSEGIRRMVDEIDESLEAWRHSLPDWLKLPQDVPEKGGERANEVTPNCVAVQVWYYTAKLLLHRPFIPQDEGLSLMDLLNDKYHKKCTQASQASFDLLSQLARARNVDRLSTDMAYIIFTTAVMFVFNARLGSGDVSNDAETDATTGDGKHRAEKSRQSKQTISMVQQLSSDAKRQFLMCKEWLKGLSERWPAASAHKKLLDGFADVGEGVLDGVTPHPFTGRRPSLANGQLISAAPEWSQMPPPMLAPPQQQAMAMPDQQGYNAFSQAQDQRQLTSLAGQSSGPAAPGNIQVPNQYGVYGLDNGTQSGGAMLPPDANVLGGVVMPQQSLNAYFEFAPNIFDMENVYWNETATRLTPYLGPRDPSTSQPQSQQPENSGAQLIDNGGQQQQQAVSLAGLPFTPRTLGHITAMANYASLGNAAVPPQVPVAQSSFPAQGSPSQQQSQPQQQPPMAPPQGLPASRWGNGGAANNAAGSSASARKRKATDSPGLQMLAQQAVGSTGASSTGSSAQSGPAMPAPSGGGSSSSGTGGGASSGFSVSPFSFHQEPSAPEWGDVISMLQLPPAFIQ